MANPNVEVKYTKLFINNEWVNSVSGKTFPTINPTSGKTIIQVSEGDKADVNKAVAAAKAAFQRNSAWRKMDASTRGKFIYKLADLMERDMAYISNLQTLENGKSFKESTMELHLSINTLRYYAGLADKVHGKTIPADMGFVSLTKLQPVGVVGQIIPWNVPTLMVSMKLAPALAAGCTLVLKPAEQTPLTALYIAALTQEVGFPPGVINVIPGYGPTAGDAIARHPEISKVAFTGSTHVGKLIMKAAAESNLKKVTCELGGKSPLIIMEDVDVDKAALLAHQALFANHGQVCCAGSRTFVHEKIYDKFINKAKDLAVKRKVGNPYLEETQQGPQIDEEQYKRILTLIESGKSQGAKLECGGSSIGNEGYFIQPTVFSNVQDEMQIAKEEIFGPVQSIIKFKTLDEAIERANKTHYGLAAGIITKDINTAIKYAQEVEAGSVWINCYNAILPQTPFGGFKESGHGRELGDDSIKEYLEVKTITIKVD